MGRHPLSRTAAGKQIKDLKEDDKLKYQDVYRPPGIVRFKPDIPIDSKPAPAGRSNPGGSSSLSGHTDSTFKSKYALKQKEDKEKEKSSFSNQDAERQLEELNRKIDKNIWMTVPNSYLYQRHHVETDKEKRLKEERMAMYKKKAEDLRKDYEEKKGEAKKKEEAKEKEAAEPTVEKKKVEKEEKNENQPLDPKTKDKLLKIQIGVIDDPKNIEIMF